METNTDLLGNDLVLDNASNNFLKETAMWAKFLAISGFIVSGIIAMFSFFAVGLFTRIGAYGISHDAGLAAGGGIMILYLGIATISFFMSMFLFRFAKKVQAALKTNDQESLTGAFQNLRAYFRFAGIISIIGLVFMVLLMAGAFVVASFSRG